MNKPFAPSCIRNAPHILAALKSRAPASGTMLEIGSGTGQHTVMFAKALPGIHWQPSDLPATHSGMRAWINEAELANVGDPLALDVNKKQEWPRQQFDLIYSANTLHIMPKTTVAALFALAPSVMRPGASMFIYGPFKENGQHSSDSNRTFDACLRATDPVHGIRDINWLKRLASDARLHLIENIAMPNNNCLLVWQRMEAS